MIAASGILLEATRRTIGHPSETKRTHGILEQAKVILGTRMERRKIPMIMETRRKLFGTLEQIRKTRGMRLIRKILGIKRAHGTKRFHGIKRAHGEERILGIKRIHGTVLAKVAMTMGNFPTSATVGLTRTLHKRPMIKKKVRVSVIYYICLRHAFKLYSKC